MKGKKQKEELISLLTDIYEELQELDHALEKHFAAYRREIAHRQEARLIDFQKALYQAERNYQSKPSRITGRRQGERRTEKFSLKPVY